MGRTIAGLAAGLVAGIAAMLLIALAGGLLYPISGEIDARDPEQIRAAFTVSPFGAKVAIMASWFAAGLVGGTVAKMISRRKGAAWTIAGVFALYVVISVLMLPMPAWMQIVSIAGPLVGGLLASHVGSTRPPEPADEDEEEEAGDAGI